jgi:hypothetical protein
MRWASEHGRRTLRKVSDMQTFAAKLQQFRERRGDNDYFVNQACDIYIEGMDGELQMIDTSDYYAIIITLGELYIEEVYPKPDADMTGGPVILHITAPGVIPACCFDDYPGGAVDALIQLPRALETIIAGRTIHDIEQDGDKVIIRLDGE